MCPFFPARAYPKLFSVLRLTLVLFLAFFISLLFVFKSIIGQEHILFVILSGFKENSGEGRCRGGFLN